MRVVRWAFALVVVVGLWVPLGSTTAEAAAAPVMHRPDPGSTSIVLSGRAAPRAVVRVQVRSSRWVTVRTVRATRAGAYRVSVPYPTRVRYVRALSSAQVSSTRAIRPRPTPVPVPTPMPEPVPTPVPEPVPTPVPTPDPTPVVEDAPAPDDCGARPAKREGGYWECSFRDDFGGTELDKSKWLVQATSYSGMTSGNYDCFPDGDAGIEVDSGLLRLTAMRELAPFACRSPYGDFTASSTAATVATRDRFMQTYGRFAFRAKFPERAVGSHAAMWLYPQDHTYGAWPHSGEIDVAEWYGAQPENVYPSVHYAGEAPLATSGWDCAMPTASTDFHTYVLEWTPTEMRFEYDGKECWSHSWTPEGLSAPAPFDKPFYIVLTQVWGSLWNTPSGDTRSSTLSVDWVRAWR